MNTPASALQRREITGPTAFAAGEVRRLASLTLTLAVMDFKVRYFGSALGYLWQLVRPLMLFGVLYLVFSVFVKFNAGVDFFPAVLLTGIVLHTFFADATTRALTSVLDRENLVRKIQFPRAVVPLAAVLTATFNLATNLAAVGVFVLATGVRPHWTWLLVPLLVLALCTFALGVGMLLSALFVRFRDIQPIWEVILQVVFYGSPILYAIEVIPSETARRAIMFNPVAALIEQMRHWLIDPNAPSAAEAIGPDWLMVFPIGGALAVCALGFWYFARAVPRIAEEL